MTSPLIRKVVIPAAGLGTRFLPASKCVPKELFTVVDRPVLQYNVDEAVAAGVEEVILIISPQKQELAAYFAEDTELEKNLEAKGKTKLLEKLRQSRVPVQITTVLQEEAKGLGHAVLMAQEAVGDEPFAVLLPDDLILAEIPCLKQMFPIWAEHQRGCVAVREVPQSKVSQYGIVAVEEGGERLHRMQSVVEKPPVEKAPSQLAVIGRYLLPSSIFDILASLPPGRLGEIQLTDALQVLAESEGFFAFEFEGHHYDAGDPVGFVAANVFCGLRREEYRQELQRLLGAIK